MKLKLACPSWAYRQDFSQYKEEIKREDQRRPYSWNDDYNTNFSAYMQQCRDNVQGKNLAKGRVPSSVYWLVDGKQILGEVSIRHKLNKVLETYGAHIGYIIRPSKRRRGYGQEILKLALHKAELLGLKKVMVTCDEKNTASQKIIERNGGVHLDNVDHDGKKNCIRRYWIDLA